MSDDGGDDSPPRPKRKIKRVVLVSSDSESDSDESIAAAATRRKRLRVVSDDGDESSGSSVVAGVRRNRPLPKLRDSEGDSDTSGWATDQSDVPKPAPSAANLPSGFASDSSEGNSDKCSICLLRFTNQEIGTPQSCEHIFCLDCITEWSKNINTCPVDRMTFDSIVVRSSIGGRVLRTEPVKVVERRPSIELLVTEDPTMCEVCGSTENEDSMLLCDGCDLGYHMECLSPPLSEIPPDQWLCPNCDELLSDVDILFSGITDTDIDVALAARRGSRESRAARPRARSAADDPSTSAGRGGARSAAAGAPSTSSGTASRASGSRGAATRRSTATYRTNRRRPKRRRTKTVIIEYEVVENGKCPVTKRVKRKLKKRKSRRRQPRTAARRTHVRESVRARLASLGQRAGAGAAGCGLGVRADALGHRGRRAGVPALSLFGDPYQLDYFSEDEHGPSERASTAVAVRPTSAILSAYRQTRRKMISVPSPPPAALAPDLLASILESQARLHCRHTVRPLPTPPAPASEDRVDPSRAEGVARKAPSYPGQSRGGWGGGYRYRDQNAAASFGGGPRNNGYAGGHQARRAELPGGEDARRAGDGPDDFPRRPRFPLSDDGPPGRGRRRSAERGRPERPPWRPPVPARHSFGGFGDPLDMRLPPRRAEPDKRPPYRPLPEPPVFEFGDAPDVDRSEDERSDPDLVIDTEKYDPTEPTNDDDDDGAAAAAGGPGLAPQFGPPPAPPFGPPPGLPFAPRLAPPFGPQLASPFGPQLTPPFGPQLAPHFGPQLGPLPAPLPDLPPGLPPAPEPASAPLPAGVLDSAVRQVLREHRQLLAPPPALDRSDDDSDGDCPNFSIYSAASVHIASGGAEPARGPARAGAGDVRDVRDMEDLVQRDDSPEPRAPAGPGPRPRSSDRELKEKVSRRCPITADPRNPIKIKLTAPTLIRKRVSLYDEEEDASEEAEDGAEPKPEPKPAAAEPKPDPEPAAAEPTLSPSAPGPADEPAADASDERPADDQPTTVLDEVDRDSDTEPPELEFERDAISPKLPASPESGGTGRRLEDLNDDRSDDGEGPEVPVDAAGKRSDESEDDEPARAESAESRPAAPGAGSEHDDNPEKMTESISETEDERSYTPCLDENKSKDTSLETDKDKGLDGLDTEMISEDEGHGVFSDGERAAEPAPAAGAGAGDAPRAEPRRKKKKDAKKEAKEKKKSKRDKAAKDVAFKKLGKGGKERNYRSGKRERRDSGDAERKQRRKDKRKDLERYDVRTLVSEKRRRPKDAFGRDVSPRARSRSPPVPSPPRRSASPPLRVRRSSSPPPRARRSGSPPIRARRSVSPPIRARRSISPPIRARRSVSPPARGRRSTTPPRRRSTTPPRRRSASRTRVTPPRVRRSPSPARRRASSSPRRARRSPSPPAPRPPPSPARAGRRRRVPGPDKRGPVRRRRSASRRKRRRSGSAARPKPQKRRRRARSERSPSRRRPSPAGSVDSRLLSPRTPPPEPSPVREPPEEPRRRREPERPRHRRARDAAGPSKEVFTSGDNILVSVSFDDRERSEGEARRSRRRERRRRRRLAPEAEAAPRPVAVIDLERSPFRELTPSPRDVIVLSDSEPGAEAPPAEAPVPGPATPPAGVAEAGPGTPPEPPDSPDAYDPYEPTRSASASPSPSPRPAHEAPRTMMTLETAQKTNMSADEVIDRRPLSPIEKVMALLQSTRDVSPEPPPDGEAAGAEPSAAPPVEAAPAPAPALPAPPAPAPVTVAPAPAPPVRIVLPSPTRSLPPKLFLAKPSPIKSDPIKPMQAAKLARPARPERVEPADSPYSPGSSDFGDLFEPPGAPERPRGRRARGAAARVPVRLDARRVRTQVGVKVDEDNLKILDDLPSSAVEMQVKSKFLKKLNRQERVVEEVKLVLKPHYNKKHVTKDEYKDILRRAVPKICHNKTGEINPSKIQALVEAYVKKFRKKHKLGLS